MRPFVLAATLAMIPNAQTTVAGVWTAAFDRTTFVRLELRAEGAALAGTINIGDIEVDDKGDLRRVGGLRTDGRAIFSVIQRGSIVTFSAKDEDDTDQFEFRIRDDGQGELRFIPTEALRAELGANGVPVPKPIALTRAPR